MSICASGWAWRQKCPDPGTKLVLIKLADYADDEGICWPAQKTVADQTGLTRESVCRAVKRLAEIGLLTIGHRATPSGRLSNIYHLGCGSERPLSDAGSHTLSDVASHTLSDAKSHAKVTPDHTLSDVRSQNPSREPSERRLDHLPTNPESSESSNRAPAPAAKARKSGTQRAGPHGAGPPGGYAYRGRIIRLAHSDFEGWKRLYFTILDLRAELESLDCFYDRTLVGAERQKWFPRCSSALNKKHQENLKSSIPKTGKSGANLVEIAREQFPRIPEGRIRELARESGCLEYGPPGEFQCWKFLHGRAD